MPEKLKKKFSRLIAEKNEYIMRLKGEQIYRDKSKVVEVPQELVQIYEQRQKEKERKEKEAEKMLPGQDGKYFLDVATMPVFFTELIQMHRDLCSMKSYNLEEVPKMAWKSRADTGLLDRTCMQDIFFLCVQAAVRQPFV